MLAVTGREPMAEQKPEPPEPSGGYRSKWMKYLLIYLVVAAVVYALIYFIFIADGGGYGS
jgi:hypothetical protein